MAAVLRAFFGYIFLILIMRIIGRRPGKQLTPFEFVIVFFTGGLALTAMVGDDASYSNALCQIIALASAHYAVVWARSRSPKIARFFDGTPLVLLEKGRWRSRTMKMMRMADDDVMASARDKGIQTLDQIETAVLERNGEISLIQASQDDQSQE